jgi:hypothetical protein
MRHEPGPTMDARQQKIIIKGPRVSLAPDPDTRRLYGEIERQWLDLAKRADEDGG